MPAPRKDQPGSKVIAMVATIEDARAVTTNNVDGIIAQASAACGHRSSWRNLLQQHAAISTTSSVRDVVQAVNVPCGS